MDGRGASAITFASLISLLNEVRLNHNFKTLGFLNTWLYKISEAFPDAFFDITEGNNQYSCCGVLGFRAATGWYDIS